MKKILGLILLIASALLLPEAHALLSIDPEVALAMSYTLVSVGRPTKTNAGVGGNKKDMLVIFDFSEVQSGLARDARGVMIAGPVVMKPGAYMVELYVTPDTINATHTPEGERDNNGWIHQVEAMHPGDDVAALEFAQNLANRPLGCFVRKCDGSVAKLYGTPCSPLMLQNTGTDDQSVNQQQFTLVGSKTGFVPGIFEGNIPLSAPLATLAAGATTVNLATGPGEYQTQGHSGSVAIATFSNAVDGLIFTLMGTNQANPPSVQASATIILKNGTTWNAIAGSKLTLKAFKSGASSFTYIEVGRA